MKKTICLILICFTCIGYSQNVEFDKKIYVYKTYEDYVNNVADEKGELDGHEWSLFSGAKIFLKSTSGNERKYFMAKNMWGFKIDKFLFRVVNNDYPVCLIKQKGKYFYSIGNLQLSRIKFDSPNMSIQVDGKVLFYSDEINSDVFEISKLKSNEKNNPEYEPIINCLKEAKKRHSKQGVLNSTIDCVQDF